LTGDRNDGLALTYLHDLEAESVFILREVVAQARNPVLLYSVGKDSSVLLHLARKAFYPAPLPFPLLHIDTGWKFREMIEFRDQRQAQLGFDLIVHVNEVGRTQGIGPFSHGSTIHTEVMKTQALKEALDRYDFDMAIGGARRDEEGSRAKERVFSMRTRLHRWDPKAQRPELWNIYNGRTVNAGGVRVFPLSNWTEIDIWSYIAAHDIPVVPLYFAQPRPVVAREGMLILRDDERLTLRAGEHIEIRHVRFRTLGCYPLTGALESHADTVPMIIAELRSTRTSERVGRAIDHDVGGSMELKKRDGYF